MHQGKKVYIVYIPFSIKVPYSTKPIKVDYKLIRKVMVAIEFHSLDTVPQKRYLFLIFSTVHSFFSNDKFLKKETFCKTVILFCC